MILCKHTPPHAVYLKTKLNQPLFTLKMVPMIPNSFVIFYFHIFLVLVNFLDKLVDASSTNTLKRHLIPGPVSYNLSSVLLVYI